MARARRVAKNLYAGRSRTPRAARLSMAGIDERLAADFEGRTRRRAQIIEQMKQYYTTPPDVVRKRKHATRVVEAIRRMQMDASRHTVRQSQGISLREQRTAAASRQRMAQRASRPFWPHWLDTSGTRIPPYDYAQWGYSLGGFLGRVGTLQKNSEAADQRSGEISIDIESGFKYGYDGVQASARALVGIDIYPSAPGLLRAWSSPALNYDWGYWLEDPTPPGAVVFVGGVQATGWIGLWVQEYSASDPVGHFIVDQEAMLWDSSWFSGYPGSVQWQAGSNPAYGLYTPAVRVNPENGYIIWVLCNADIIALAEGESTSAVAWAILNVSVPFITWELTREFSVLPTTQATAASRRALG